MICLIPKVTSTFLAKTSRTVNNCGGYENCGKLSTKSEVTVNRCRGSGYFLKKRQKSSTCRAIPLWNKSHFWKPFLSKVQKSKLTIFFFSQTTNPRAEGGRTNAHGGGGGGQAIVAQLQYQRGRPTTYHKSHLPYALAANAHG